ncbi:response regulator transcription factor [Nitratireductor aquimarinus]|uniref:response regulator transcription factor n=1 Tax=Alphaproteobacteria TaxID=28211 RepID=UPI000DE173BA|nr:MULTISPECIES: response regulator [Alphaproteobacteria]MBY6022604.1 response regulator [Nitratireductor sp. DP7N14-4]MBN7757813.1 response regulator transcription factor [Nitratireductor aquimarinus]MBN7762278.1 response regulator transcription factor [Nitratireductor aquibiodomus]MBN7778000.1 response regulator transcription factor [Nitratireductor pacificus]MBN7782322.1 response regulator transcription factor [Nitratireductor pacificus]
MSGRPVYLVDDDEAVRRALVLLLSTVDVDVKSFPDPESFLAALGKLPPGCLIFDIRMPVISGLKLQERLIAQGIDWPTVVISGHGDIEACRRAFRNGAVDFLSKPVDEQDLIDAIQKAQDMLDRSEREAAEHAETADLLASLTGRESEVLERIAGGFTTKEIAASMAVSPRTVESHRASIGAKLGTTSAAEMTRLWLQANRHP